MAYSIHRAYNWFNRFGTLRRVERAFQDAQSPTFVRRSLFGFNLEVDVSRSTAQQLLLFEGERFIEERFLLQRLLRRGMAVVDVGANIGYYLLMFEKGVGPDGKVICIEPSGENLPELMRNIDINDFRNVILHAVALGSIDGETGLQSGINSGVVEAGEAAYRVPLRRLDHLVDEKIDFLKIDVEGYEGQVLDGASELLERHRPVLFLELHPHIVIQFGYSIARILESLRCLYSNIVMYERLRPEEQELVEKIGTRYLGVDPVRAIVDCDAYVRRYDPGDVVHTFWAVCQP